MTDNKKLTITQKIILFAFVSLIIGLPYFIRKIMILNFGFGYMRPMRLYFQFIPLLYIMYLGFRSKEFKTPYLFLFLLLIGGFFCLENLPIRLGFPKDYQFIWQQMDIYIFFLMLVNFGRSRRVFYKVIDYAFYCALILCAILISGYAGLLKISYTDIALKELLFYGRAQLAVHPNEAAYICVFGALLLIIKQLNERNFTLPHIIRDVLCMFVFNGIIIISSTRGALVISAGLTLYYVLFIWRHFIKRMSNYNKYALIFMMVLIAVSSIYLIINSDFGSRIPDLLIYKRFVFALENFSNCINTAGGVNMRFVNNENAWRNFLNHPFAGVGFVSAAKNFELGTGTRANNQYLHMLASSGIFFFILYLYYNFRLVACRIALLKRPEVALCLFYHAFYLFLRRPLNITAIMAYTAFYFYYQDRVKDAGGI